MLDVGLGLRLLTPRALKDYRGWYGTEDFAPQLRPRRGYGAGCEGEKGAKARRCDGGK